MKKRIIILMLIIPLFLFMSCPPEKNEPIELEIYETYCTSIELKITMQDSLKEKEYSVKRNDSLIANGTITENQIIITDENLEPNTQYTYKAYSKNDESKMLTVTTMDTTNHDFVWDIDTLGNYGSSLRDVAIIDENDIWVVGEIRTDSTNYNAAHWDGDKWELKRIKPQPFLFASITAIYIIDDEIWTAGTAPMRIKNGNWIAFPNFPTIGWINSIWSSSSDDMYFVGDNGSIVHYDGSNFEKMESGTDVELTDIIGYGNDIWICGFTQTDEIVIMKNTDNGFERWYSNPYNEYINYDNSKISGPIISIWTDSEKYLWAITYWGLCLIGSDNPYSFKIYSNINAWNGYIFSLSGNAKNDLFFCGDRTTIWHFNGVSNHYYEELKGDISLRKVKSSNEIVVIVGSDYATNKAVIIRGKKKLKKACIIQKIIIPCQ